MKYIIFIQDEDKQVALYRELEEEDSAYLREQVIPNMKSLSDDEYMYGPSCIVRTPARFSYVVDGDEVYWCIDWQPGLLVIRFSPDGSMKWAAMKSSEDNENCDDPQYRLVYRAWDAQMCEQDRVLWDNPTDDLIERHQRAMIPVGDLHKRLESGFKSQEELDAYIARCEKSPIWKGKVSMG